MKQSLRTLLKDMRKALDSKDYMLMGLISAKINSLKNKKDSK